MVLRDMMRDATADRCTAADEYKTKRGYNTKYYSVIFGVPFSIHYSFINARAVELSVHHTVHHRHHPVVLILQKW
jgi:hypothetical protein